MKKKGIWKHKKYGKREYSGSYAWGFISDPRTERVFVLKSTQKGGKEHICVFESHESAKNNGWRKL